MFATLSLGVTFLKISSAFGQFIWGPRFISAFNEKVRLVLRLFFMMKNIQIFNRTLNRRKNKSGSLLFRLCGIEFVGNFRLSERSEFRKFPLSKFNGTKEIRKSRVAFLLVTFLWRSKEK